jgi:hypothetical protein
MKGENATLHLFQMTHLHIMDIFRLRVLPRLIAVPKLFQPIEKKVMRVKSPLRLGSNPSELAKIHEKKEALQSIAATMSLSKSYSSMPCPHLM